MRIAVDNLPTTMTRFWLVISSISLLFTFSYSNFGLDLTDESFYLLSILHPGKYVNTLGAVSNFGQVFGVVFEFLSYNIVLLRVFNILLTLLFSFVLAYQILGYNNVIGNTKTDRLLLSFILATPSVLITRFDGLWLATPSYNSLNLLGLLVVSIGLFLSEENKHVRKRQVLALITVSAGLILSFLAKPTSAALAYLLTLAFILSRRTVSKMCKAKDIGIVTIAFFVLLLAFIRVAFEKPHYYLKSTLTGLDSMRLLTQSNSFDIAHELEKITPNTSIVVDFFVGCFVMVSIWTLFSRGRRRRFVQWQTFLGLSAMLLATLTIILTSNNTIVSFYGIVCATLFLLRPSMQSRCKQGNRKYLSLILLFMPLVYAFGSGNHYWVASQTAVVFASLGTISLILSSRNSIEKIRRLVVIFVTVTQIVTSYSILEAVQNPYRQPTYSWIQNEELPVGPGESKLRVSANVANLVLNLRNVASENGFAAGDPILDLTGRSPGLILALNGFSVGAPWMLGGYLGSTKYAEKLISATSCKVLSRAWVLTEPSGARAISPEVLRFVGASLERDYIEVSGWASLSTSDASPGGPRQSLSRPTDSKVIMKRCTEFRKL